MYRLSVYRAGSHMSSRQTLHASHTITRYVTSIVLGLDSMESVYGYTIWTVIKNRQIDMILCEPGRNVRATTE